MTSRRALLTAATLAAAVAVAADTADAARRTRQPARVGRVDAPLGIQGVAGTGPNVVVPFTLVDPRRKPSDIEAQYAFDANGDGTITDDEFRPATEDRRDVRNTRRNRQPQLFVTSGDAGAAHAFVWRSTADVLAGRHETLLYRFTDQGRLIPDPAVPGEYLHESGLGGVKFRIRALVRTARGWVPGEWTTSSAFDLNNSLPPAARFDEVTGGDDVVIRWTALDPDSEDLNGNGVFDPGEDLDHDAIFRTEQVGVAFDFHRLAEGEDPATMTLADLEAVWWLPCTRAPGQGDTDSFREPAPTAGEPDLRVFATPTGRQWTFVWDAGQDVSSDGGPFILRARPIDAQKQLGAWTYHTQPVLRD